MTALNWKARGNGRYNALASREVGGKYFIEWVESYYSQEYCERFEVRRYRVDYRRKGSGGRGNIDNIDIRTLARAKALAELHHQKQRELLRHRRWRRAVRRSDFANVRVRQMTPPRRVAVQIYCVHCYALPGVNAVRSLKAVLKLMLRRYGLRVISIETEDAKPKGGKNDR
jgi:hypothetical protein